MKACQYQTKFVTSEKPHPLSLSISPPVKGSKYTSTFSLDTFFVPLALKRHRHRYHWKWRNSNLLRVKSKIDSIMYWCNRLSTGMRSIRPQGFFAGDYYWYTEWKHDHRYLPPVFPRTELGYAVCVATAHAAHQRKSVNLKGIHFAWVQQSTTAINSPTHDLHGTVWHKYFTPYKYKNFY